MTENEILISKIQENLLKVGIVSSVQGYNFMTDAIALVYQNPTLSRDIVKGLYAIIAEKYTSTPSKVERSIRHCIVISANNGVFKKIPEFRSQVGNNAPTNKTAVVLFAQILKKEIERSQVREVEIKHTDTDDVALQRALRTKLLVRVNRNGEVCPPWSDEVANIKSGARLFYAKPCSITKQLGASDEYLVEASKNRANLHYLTTIHTYFDVNLPNTNDFSATIIGVLKQLPIELVGRTRGFEFVDYNLGEHQLVYSEKLGRVARFVGTRLYGAEKEYEIPDEVGEEPIIYGNKSIAPRNMNAFLSLLEQNQ